MVSSRIIAFNSRDFRRKLSRDMLAGVVVVVAAAEAVAAAVAAAVGSTQWAVGSRQ